MKRRNTARISESSGRRTVVVEPTTSSSSDHGVKTGVGRFNFRNGDSYEGCYRLDIGGRTLVKQDRGTYVTDNFDAYDGSWRNDGFAGDGFRIRYSDNARYEGNVDASGAMDGAGTYVFPDGSSLTAIWSRNEPVSGVVYREALGHEWTTESISDRQVSFTTGNHFWNEVASDGLSASVTQEDLSSLVRL